MVDNIREDLTPSLPDTQTQATQNTVVWSQTVEPPKIWGWLYPLRTYLKSSELAGEEIVLGRSPNCDVVFNGTNISPNILRVVSKIHCKIIRSVDTEYSTAMVKLNDHSHNGTFVNGVKVGKGNNVLLQNNDEISFGHPNLKLFVFKSVSNDDSVPYEVSCKYIVTEVLGTGASGEVRLAYEKNTSMRFAIKRVAKKRMETQARVSGKPLELDKIMNEVKILKTLQHPCIIRMQDVIDTKHAIYIVLELMEGGELFDRLIHAQLKEFDAKVIFYQIALGVKYLHDNGVVHRDLKPENILMATRGQNTLVKITDFGMSKLVNNASLMETVCGTPYYVAPEVLMSQNTGPYSKQVDVWSLGVILYAMLGNILPFSSEDSRATLPQQIVRAMYTFPDENFGHCSSSAISLIKSMLVVDASKRIRIDDVLKHDWLQHSDVIERVKQITGENNIYSVYDGDEHDVFDNPWKRPRLTLSVDTDSASSSNTINDVT